MPFWWLFLWLNVNPAALLTGALVGFCAYWLAHPRPTLSCLGVLEEFWRIYALAVGAVGFALGAQLHLWMTFSWRPPVSLSHLGTALGLTVLALSPVPIVVSRCNDSLPRRSIVASIALVAVGVALWIGDAWGFNRSWSRLTEAARTEAQALHDVTYMRALRFVSAEKAIKAVDASRSDVPGLVALAHSAQSELAFLDESLRTHMAARIAAESSPGEAESAAAAVWWLTHNPATLAGAYARAHPDAGVPTQNEIAAIEAALVHAEQTASDALLADLLAALDSLVGRRPLEAATEGALASIVNGREAGLSESATRILFRNGSRASLRVVLPLFNDPDAPSWSLLITDCPKSTAALVALVDDPDSAVASGAKVVLAWVRQYCVSSAPVTG